MELVNLEFLLNSEMRLCLLYIVPELSKRRTYAMLLIEPHSIISRVGW